MSKLLKTQSVILFTFIVVVLWQSNTAPTLVGRASSEDMTAAISTIAVTIKNQIDIEAVDIAFDKNSNMLFASVSSSANVYPNSIVPINVATGQIGTPIFVGNAPNRIEISDDGTFLYVGLDNNGSVKRIDLSTMMVDLEFFLGSDNCGLYLVEDLVVLSGQPESVAISRRNTGCSPRHEGVAIYDNGIIRPNTSQDHTGSNSIEPSNSPTTLYGYNNESTEFGFRHLHVDAQGVQEESVTLGILDSTFRLDIQHHQGYVYATNGRVIDPATDTIKGSFASEGPFAVDTGTNQIFFTNSQLNDSPTLEVFDLDTFQQNAQVAIPILPNIYSPEKITHLASNLFALLNSNNDLYLLEIKELTNSIYLATVMNDFCAAPFTDDFSSTFGNWPIIDTGDYSTSYWSGEYRLMHNTANRWIALTRGDYWENSDLLQVDGRIVSGDGAWGLVFGLNDNWTNFYTFEIIPSSQTWVAYQYNSGWDLLGSGVSNAINPGTLVNTLSVSRPNYSLELQINGTTVRYLTNYPGRVGLTGGSFSPNTEIRYDNYVFADEGCLYAAQSIEYSTISAVSPPAILERPDLEMFFSEDQ